LHAVQGKDDEPVVFWPSREVRDQGMKKVMADPRLKPGTNPMPLRCKTHDPGDFEIIVEA
jgi:uncharacterized protein YbaA (DUF1428 family)